MIRHPLFHEVSTNPAGILEFHARYIYVHIYMYPGHVVERNSMEEETRECLEEDPWWRWMAVAKKRYLISPMIDALSLITLFNWYVFITTLYCMLLKLDEGYNNKSCVSSTVCYISRWACLIRISESFPSPNERVFFNYGLNFANLIPLTNSPFLSLFEKNGTV